MNKIKDKILKLNILASIDLPLDGSIILNFSQVFVAFNIRYGFESLFAYIKVTCSYLVLGFVDLIEL